GGLDAQEGVDQVFHGMTLFQLVSSSENSQIQQDERQTAVPIGVFAFPRTHGGTVMPQGGYEGWIVPKAGKEPALAESFIDMMLSPSTANFLGSHGWLPSARAAVQGSGWLEQYQQALGSATPGIYLDAAPVANLNATMEANVQLLLQGYENPTFLTHSLQESYASRGKRGSTARIDGEF
ncbi:MAG: extracellular solute-binding protein, partial [Chloroflexota bacterium]